MRDDIITDLSGALGRRDAATTLQAVRTAVRVVVEDVFGAPSGVREQHLLSLWAPVLTGQDDVRARDGAAIITCIRADARALSL